MRPRARDKKLQEEWAVPLQSVEDINEVDFDFCRSAQNIDEMMIKTYIVFLWGYLLSYYPRNSRTFALVS